jgi:hypothetical protein
VEFEIVGAVIFTLSQFVAEVTHAPFVLYLCCWTRPDLQRSVFTGHVQETDFLGNADVGFS